MSVQVILGTQTLTIWYLAGASLTLLGFVLLVIGPEEASDADLKNASTYMSVATCESEDQIAPDVREAEDFEMPEDEEAAEDEAMDGDTDKVDEEMCRMEDGSDRDGNEAADEDMELSPADQE